MFITLGRDVGWEQNVVHAALGNGKFFPKFVHCGGIAFIPSYMWEGGDISTAVFRKLKRNVLHGVFKMTGLVG
jgi:hypothetical protein